MTLSEYSLSVLQLGEMPILKLVPRLPGIKKGKIVAVNFSDFNIDKESLGPIIQALSDGLCRLKTLKLSIGSLRLLDFESCAMLGAFLRRQSIDVRISQTVDHLAVLDMFKTLDTTNTGYLSLNEFTVAFNSFRHHSKLSNTNGIIKNSKEMQLRDMIFRRLAIRNIKRDRIYFSDFYDHFFSFKERLHGFDITQIDYPIHFCFEYLLNCLQNFYQFELGIVNNDNNNKRSNNNIHRKQTVEQLSRLVQLPRTQDEWNQLLDIHLIKLYYFNVGFGNATQVLPPSNQSILITLIDTFEYIKYIESQTNIHNTTQIQRLILKKCQWFVWRIFKNLLKQQSVLDLVLYKSKRNNINGIKFNHKNNYNTSSDEDNDEDEDDDDKEESPRREDSLKIVTNTSVNNKKGKKDEEEEEEESVHCIDLCLKYCNHDFITYLINELLMSKPQMVDIICKDKKFINYLTNIANIDYLFAAIEMNCELALRFFLPYFGKAMESAKNQSKIRPLIKFRSVVTTHPNPSVVQALIEYFDSDLNDRNRFVQKDILYCTYTYVQYTVYIQCTCCVCCAFCFVCFTVQTRLLLITIYIYCISI